VVCITLKSDRKHGTLTGKEEGIRHGSKREAREGEIEGGCTLRYTHRRNRRILTGEKYVEWACKGAQEKRKEDSIMQRE
ncbi:hypothetical protein KI387_033108, partial [Taxus chinensis]